MKHLTKLVLAGALAAGFAAQPASAMPAAPGDVVAPATAPGVEKSRWICDAWGRCWWRGGYGYRRGWGGYGGGYGAYGGGWGHRGYGWGHRGWHGGWGHHGWGHHW